MSHFLLENNRNFIFHKKILTDLRILEAEWGAQREISRLFGIEPEAGQT
jgi:hypothetical protein